MAKLQFYHEEKKRVKFTFSTMKEINTYLQENTEATLIIDFSDLLLSRDQKSVDFGKLEANNIHKLLFISKPVDNKYQLHIFEKLPNLLELDDRSPVTQINYNFLHYPRLEKLLLTWDKKFSNLHACHSLKELSLWNYKPIQKNLLEYTKLKNIKELRIVQSNIQSTQGVEELPKLQSLTFIANKALKLNELKQPLLGVTQLYIEACPQISILQIPKLFPNLEDLTFHNKEEINSLKEILVALPRLTKLNVYQLKILETDNTYWKDYTNLLEFNFANRNYQKLKRKDFDNV